jgi:hypothetical protein
VSLYNFSRAARFFGSLASAIIFWISGGIVGLGRGFINKSFACMLAITYLYTLYVTTRTFADFSTQESPKNQCFASHAWIVPHSSV